MAAVPNRATLLGFADTLDQIGAGFCEVAERLRDAARSKRVREEAFSDAERWFAGIQREIDALRMDGMGDTGSPDEEAII